MKQIWIFFSRLSDQFFYFYPNHIPVALDYDDKISAFKNLPYNELVNEVLDVNSPPTIQIEYQTFRQIHNYRTHVTYPTVGDSLANPIPYTYNSEGYRLTVPGGAFTYSCK